MKLCDNDCNHCPIILHPHNRMITSILNALYEKFGEGVHEIVQDHCPNLTVCYDCRIDDFVHIKGCELSWEIDWNKHHTKSPSRLERGKGELNGTRKSSKSIK